jgi:hypothetical protein
LAIFLAWKIAKFYFTRFKKTEEKVANLPCSSHSNTLNKHRNALLEIGQEIFGSKRYKSYSISLSPRQLSELGQELYQKSGVQRVLENNMPYFIEKLEKEHPKTALDAEDMAHFVLLSSRSEDIFNPVKNWIYNNPKFNDTDIDMSDINYVASLPLRNAYLQKHPEILPEEPV